MMYDSIKIFFVKNKNNLGWFVVVGGQMCVLRVGCLGCDCSDCWL